MTIDNKYISRRDAAEVIGVHPQTISNYIERGFFKSHQIHGMIYLDRKEFFENLPKVKKIAFKEDELEKYRNELEAELVKVKDNIRRVKRELSASDTLARTFHNSLSTIIKAVAKMDNLGMSYKDIEAVDMFWQSNNYSSIAELLGICERSVCTAMQIRLRRLADAFTEEAEKHKVIRELYEKLARQRQCISQLTDTKAKLLSNLCKYEEKARIEKQTNIYINPHLYETLCVHLSDLNFSVRCKNSLRYGKIETVRDLVKFSKRDLLKIRNFGKKSLSELTEFVEDIGLRFEMADKDISAWLSRED